MIHIRTLSPSSELSRSQSSFRLGHWRGVHARDNVTIIGSETRTLFSIGSRSTHAMFVGPPYVKEQPTYRVQDNAIRNWRMCQRRPQQKLCPDPHLAVAECLVGSLLLTLLCSGRMQTFNSRSVIVSPRLRTAMPDARALLLWPGSPEPERS